MKLLTISIAAYNVEKYIDKLLGSIIATDMNEEIEVLVVNDGSQDKTEFIASQYEQKYSNTIKLVNKENGGHGSTINKGLYMATGKYFKVIDGDDWVDPEGLNKLVRALRDEESDMIITNYDKVYEDGEILLTEKPGIEEGKLLDFNEKIASISNRESIVFHSIYYKTELLKKNNIKITENCFYVDTQYVLFPLPYINTFSYYDFTVYCYRLGRVGQSVSLESMKKHEKEHDTVVMTNLEYYLKNSADMSDNLKAFSENYLKRLAMTSLNLKFANGISVESLNKAIKFDDYLKNYSMIYEFGNKTKTIKLWRKSRKFLYIPIKLWIGFKIRYNGSI